MLSAENELHIQLTMSFFTQQILPDGSFVAVQDIILAGYNSSAITFPIKLTFSLLTKEFATNIALDSDAP